MKAKMFNRKASSIRNKPNKVLESLDISQGQVVADIGVGGGYFSNRIAEIVEQKGRVYAVDTNSNLLKYVRERANNEGLKNLFTILAKNESFRLPEKVDLIFMRNICHHLKNRKEYFKNLKQMMNPNGKIAIVEYEKKRSFSYHSIFGHYVPKEILVKEMQEAGFRLEKTLTFLPDQSFTIYGWN